MVVYGTELLTMVEHAQRSKLDGMPAVMVDPLRQSTPILDDAPMRPTNETLVHKTTVLTGRPTVTRGRFQDAYTSSRATTTPRVEGCERIMAECVIEAEELEAFNNPRQRRLDEAKTFWPVMAEQAEYDVIYGDTTTSDKQINGFQARRATLGDYCLSAGGTAGGGVELTSIYICNWGEGLHLIHPQNKKAGIDHEDFGRGLWPVSTDLGTGDQKAYKETYDLYFGLSNPMDCDLIRIANIDMDAAKAQSGTQALTAVGTNIQYAIDEAIDRVKSLGAGARIYMGRSMHSYFKKMARARGAANTWDIEYFNKVPRLTCDGIQVRIADKLGFNEAQAA